MVTPAAAIGTAKETATMVGKGLSWGARLLQFGPVKKAAAWAGTPLFVNLKKRREAEAKLIDSGKITEKQAAEKKQEKKGFLNVLKENFAYGDIALILGGIGWLVSGRFLKVDQSEGASPWKNLVKGWSRLGMGILGVIGFFGARVAQSQGLHMMRALGKEEYAKYVLSKVEQTLKKSLIENLDIQTLISEADTTKLVYNKNEYGRDNPILTLHQGDSFKTYLSGDSGVGKTSGARLVCGRYAARKAAEGKKNVVVKILNGTALHEYFRLESNLDKVGEAGKMLFDEGTVENTIGFLKGDPLNITEAVLIKLNSELKKARENNEDLILIVDEVDSLLPLHLLQEDSFDVRKLDELVRSLQKLMDQDQKDLYLHEAGEQGSGEKILFTSNYDIGEYVKMIPLPEKSKAGFLGRVSSIYVEKPNPITQAEQIANYLVDVPSILVKSGRITSTDRVFDDKINGAIKIGKQKLANLIYEQVTKNNPYNYLVGRSVMRSVNEILCRDYLNDIQNNASSRITLDSIKSALSFMNDEEKRKYAVRT